MAGFLFNMSIHDVGEVLYTGSQWWFVMMIQQEQGRSFNDHEYT